MYCWEYITLSDPFFRAYKDTTTDVDSNNVHFNGLIFMVDFVLRNMHEERLLFSSFLNLICNFLMFKYNYQSPIIYSGF